MKTKTKVDIKKKYGLDDLYDLVYVDYRESIEDPKMIEKMVKAGDTSPLDEDSDWLMDSQWEGVKYVLDELEKEFPDISDEDKEEIKDYLYDHDSSTPIQDLMRNTSSGYYFYSLGLTDHGMELEGGGPYEERVKAILERLKMDDPKIRKVVSEIINNAGYGGTWVMLFEDDIEDMLQEGNAISFGPKAELCLMDRWNGSGHSKALGFPLTCEFDRANLHYDCGASGYSFTKDVCGMTRGFMDGASIKTLPKNELANAVPILRSEEDERRAGIEDAREKKWRETTTCSSGDMNIERHPKDQMDYINNFPCGNKCHACGTFWVD